MQPVSTKIATFFYPEIKAGLEMELREVPNPPHVELGIKKKKKILNCVWSQSEMLKYLF